MIGGVLIARPHWLAWAAAAAVAASAMIGYVLTRGLRGGFLGDHGDVGNWHCPLGIAALSVESVIILLVLLVVLGAWQARIHATSVAGQTGLPRGARPNTADPDDQALAQKEYHNAHVLTAKARVIDAERPATRFTDRGPAIVFIDEIDALGARRDAGGIAWLAR